MPTDGGEPQQGKRDRKPGAIRLLRSSVSDGGLRRRAMTLVSVA